MPPVNRTVLVHQDLSSADNREDLDELRLLAQSAGADVCACVTGRRSAPGSALFIGRGKAQEVAEAVQRCNAQLVVINHSISPVQERNLERIVGCRVLDRTGLILDIFAQRAHTHEGKLQVELAQLRHLSTRLVRGWTHLERQKGGIGLRGPGESQLETDRRLIGERIKTLNRRLQRVQAQRGQRRRARSRIPIPTVSLVGYTNAGKSSLFNALTRSRVYAADQLFATLDPTMRRVELPNHQPVILADTVGFIRHLPHGLVAAFRATLEEVATSQLLLHVVDAAAADYRDNIAQVESVLAEIGADQVPVIRVYNKIDLTGRPAGFERDDQGRIHALWVSAIRQQGLDLLRQAVSEHFRRGRERLELHIPFDCGRQRARVHQRLDVLAESIGEKGWRLTVEVDAADRGWLQAQPGVELIPAAEPAGPDATVLARHRASP